LLRWLTEADGGEPGVVREIRGGDVRRMLPGDGCSLDWVMMSEQGVGETGEVANGPLLGTLDIDGQVHSRHRWIGLRSEWWGSVASF